MSNPPLADAARLLDERFGLAALWLFGSRAAGRARPHSDVDLAVLLLRDVSALELVELRAELVATWGLEVDLVDLARASPALARQVLRHGQLVFDSVPKVRLAFTAALPSRYEDLRIVRGPIERLIRERVHG